VRERRRRALDALGRVGLEEFVDLYPSELSGGMRQRLALARALALDADLLLMDEPLSALDALTREDLQDLLLALWRDRRHTAVLVTHSIEEAVYLGRKVLVMSPRPGRIAAVVDNPGMGAEEYRQTEEFYEKCAELRRLLAAQGALHTGGAAS
jgi:NitT/TauT family transport system ATP-binding protein